MTTSAPAPSVRRLIASTGASSLKLMTSSAPNFLAISQRTGIPSTTIIFCGPVIRMTCIQRFPMSPPPRMTRVSPGLIPEDQDHITALVVRGQKVASSNVNSSGRCRTPALGSASTTTYSACGALAMTLSPGENPVTSAPTASTTPAAE